MTLSRRGNQWLASVLGDPSLSVSAHNTRTARRLIGAKIQERHGAIAFSVEIVLSKGQEIAVQKYRVDERQLRSLAESVPRARLRRVEELLALNLSQEEVAGLLGITRSHLAVCLKRASSTRARTDAPARRTSRAQA